MNRKTGANRILALVFGVAWCGTGCQTGERSSGGDSEIADLKTENESLKEEVQTLKTELDDLKSEFSLHESLKHGDEVAFLTPGSDGYSPIRTNLGTITISLENVREYANGSRITLQFGNTTSASIDRLKATVDYGPVDEKGLPQNDKSRSKEFTISKSFQPGSWTSAEVTLEGVTPKDLGFVRLHDLEPPAIRLLRR